MDKQKPSKLALFSSIIAGSGSPAHVAMQSRVSIFVSGNLITDSSERCRIEEKEDVFASTITLSMLLTGAFIFLLSFQLVGFDDVFMTPIWTPQEGDYIKFLGWLGVSGALGISLSLVCMAVASRFPVPGFVLSVAAYLLSMSYLGSFLSGLTIIPLAVILLFSGGAWAWSGYFSDPWLRYSARAVSLSILLAGCLVVITDTSAAKAIADWNRMAWVAQIIVPFALCLILVALSAMFGAALHAITTASSTEISPYTTSSYAICLIAVVLWVAFLHALLRAYFRNQENRSL